MTIKEREKRRAAFVNGLLSAAQAKGVTKARIKREAFPSYSTGNRRIEHKHGEITLNDIFNVAEMCRISPAELLAQAIGNMT